MSRTGRRRSAQRMDAQQPRLLLNHFNFVTLQRNPPRDHFEILFYIESQFCHPIPVKFRAPLTVRNQISESCASPVKTVRGGPATRPPPITINLSLFIRTFPSVASGFPAISPSENSTSAIQSASGVWLSPHFQKKALRAF